MSIASDKISWRRNSEVAQVRLVSTASIAIPYPSMANYQSLITNAMFPRVSPAFKHSNGKAVGVQTFKAD
jgi:hypothetical protein